MNGPSPSWRSTWLPQILSSFAANASRAFRLRACNAAAECSAYTELTDEWRNVGYGYDFPRCDNILRAGWYRPAGLMGTRLLDTAPGDFNCGTHAPGWIDGHPALIGETTTQTVCYDWSGPSSDCTWSHSITVTNCGDFYVYNLIPTPWGCSGVYCGE